MKKVLIIFAGVLLALTSCKTQTDGLASAGVDDVYYNPKTDRKPNVAPQPEQYSAKAVDPNAGKIAATPADENNPYYRDPEFNYDDYYDNAYAARIRRFNNPIYGTGYYDTYNTNAYFYNGNPSYYGSSIYSSYNMGYGSGNGWGYYSPSASFWNSYYNPYYNGYGYGNGWNSGWSGGYGYNPYGMCSGYGYSPYGYNSYGYGGGYGYSPYGYNPYGYGMGGYSPYGYSPMSYYNPYDYNSQANSNFGPRGTHAGGNSTITSPIPKPQHMEVSKPLAQDGSNTPFSSDRFNQVVLPRDHYEKVQAIKNPVKAAPIVVLPGSDGQGNPSHNGGSYSSGGSSNDGRPIYSNGSGNGSYSGGSNSSQPASSGNGGSRPRKLVIGGADGGGNTNGNGGNAGQGGGTLQWNGGSDNSGNPKGGGNTNGGGNNGGSTGSGTFRPRK
jgi:hypothetical protein